MNSENLINALDELNRLQKYVQGLSSAMNAKGDPISRDGVCALLEPVETSLESLNERLTQQQQKR